MFIRSLFVSLALLATLPLTSCESLNGLTTEKTMPVLQAVTVLASNITEWQKGHDGSAVSNDELKKLNGFASQSDNLRSQLKQTLEASAPEQREKLAPLEDSLAKLAGFDFVSLMDGNAGDRKSGVDQFVGLAAELQKLVANLNS